MKKHENIITIGAVALLLGMVLMPCINAMMLEGETVETLSTSGKTNEGYMNEEENHNTEPIGYGSIYGETYGLKGWMAYPLPGVHIEARIGNTVVGMDTSNIFAKYRIRMLPIGYTYTVIASCPGYDIDTAEITLTSDEPHVRVGFGLERNDEYDLQIKYITSSSSQILQSLVKATNR